jgi:hypothetical protein
MDIDSMLDKMSVDVDKSKTYLKGLYNTTKLELSEQFGEALSDERIVVMALGKVGKKYGLEKTDIDRYSDAGETVGDLESDDDEEETVSKLTITDDPNHGEGGDAWDRFLSTIPDPTTQNKTYEKTPSLKVELGPTYYLKMTPPIEPPYAHEFEGKFGPYTKYAFKVMLIKVSDADMYDVVYDYGDFIGKPAFVDGNNYTLWLDDKATGYMKLFWKRTTDDGKPDERIFTFKYTKKGTYNVWSFGLPKER